MAESEEQPQNDLFQDFRATFDTEHGRRVLAHILKMSHIYQTSFSNECKGFPELLAFREGERNVGLQIAAIMRLDGQDLQEIAETE